jgi:hypothetical protein
MTASDAGIPTDSVLRQRKTSLVEHKTGHETAGQPVGNDTDVKDKEEVTWGKTASGQGKFKVVHLCDIAE